MDLSITVLISLTCSLAVGQDLSSVPVNEVGIYDLDSKNFDLVTENDEKFTIVKFYAPWCGYCQQLEPIYEEFGIEHEDNEQLQIAEVNCDNPKSMAVCQKQAISGYPTIKLYQNGVVLDQFMDDMSVESLTEFISEWIDDSEGMMDSKQDDIEAALLRSISEAAKGQPEEEVDEDEEEEDDDDDDDDESDFEIIKLIKVELLNEILAKEQDAKVQEVLKKYVSQIEKETEEDEEGSSEKAEKTEEKAEKADKTDESSEKTKETAEKAEKAEEKKEAEKKTGQAKPAVDNAQNQESKKEEL